MFVHLSPFLSHRSCWRGLVTTIWCPFHTVPVWGGGHLSGAQSACLLSSPSSFEGWLATAHFTSQPQQLSMQVNDSPSCQIAQSSHRWCGLLQWSLDTAAHPSIMVLSLCSCCMTLVIGSTFVLEYWRHVNELLNGAIPVHTLSAPFSVRQCSVHSILTPCYCCLRSSFPYTRSHLPSTFELVERPLRMC